MLSGTRKPKYNDCHDSTIQMKMRILTPIDIVYLGKKNYVKGCILVGSLLAENKPRQLREREWCHATRSQIAQAMLGSW